MELTLREQTMSLQLHLLKQNIRQQVMKSTLKAYMHYLHLLGHVQSMDFSAEHGRIRMHPVDYAMEILFG